MGDWIASHGDLVKGFFTALAGVLLLALAPSLWGVATAVFAVLGPFALMTAAILAASAAVALLYEDWVVWTHGGKAALGDLFQFFADGWKKVVQVFDSSLARLKQGWKDVKAFVGMEDTEPTHPVAKAVVAAAKVNRGARVTQELGDLIGSGEGTYTSINRGTSHGKILGSGKQANLTDMTIGGVMAQQRIHSEAMKRGVPGQGLFAVGKYQFTPDTLASAVKKLGLKEGAKFSPQTQDELFAASLPPEVFQYSQGKASKDAATEALSHMWASVGAPSRNGGSYYGSGNKASISTQQVGSVLDNMKLAYRNQVGKMSAEHPVGGDNSTSVQIDSINIHTQATDAPGLARTISDAIRSQTTVSQSDAGMS
jgi:hypothetical protein